MSTYSALTLRVCLCLAAVVFTTIDTGHKVPWWHSSAFAESAGVSEGEAFEAAKSLGTVEAWDAFLSNYPTGFHADLARAYVKKLTEGTQAPSPSPTAPAVSANDDFPVAAGSWGGVLRDGPGREYRQIGSLKEGEPVTLMGRSDVVEDGFPWFKITSQSGQTGYQWGGILCSTGAERPDLFKTCPVGSRSQSGAKKPSKSGAPKKPRCKNGGEWDGLRCRPAGFFDKPKKKRCPSGEYLNQNGVCQPNETGQ
jgi:hypothetical protein